MARWTIAEDEPNIWTWSRALAEVSANVGAAWRRLRRADVRSHLISVANQLSPERLCNRLYRFRPYSIEPARWQNKMRWREAPPAIATLGRRAGRTLWLERALTVMGRNLIVGLTILLAALVLDSLLLLSIPIGFVLLALGVYFVRGLVLAIKSRPSDWQALRVVDLRLGTRQKLATALELAHFSARGALVERQRLSAIEAARLSLIAGGLPFQPPWRELRVTGLLTLAAALVIAVQPMLDLSAIRGKSSQETALQEAARLQSLENDLGLDLSDRDALANRQPRNLAEAIQQLLNRLFNPSAAQDQALASLSAASSTIQEEYTRSILKEAALAQLAQAWKEGSSTREIADALNRGEYDAAASGMETLGERLGDLSADARQQIADGLRQASQNAAQFDADLSQLMQQTGRAIETGDDRGARDRLNDLGQATRDTGRQVASRDDFADALDSLAEGQLAIRDAMQDQSGYTDMDSMLAPDDGSPGSQGGQDGRSGQMTGAQATVALGSQQAGGMLGQARSVDPNAQGKRDNSDLAEGDTKTVRPPGQGGDSVEPGSPDPNAIPLRGSGSNRPVEPGFQGKVVTPPDSNLIPWNLRPTLRRYFTPPETRK